MFSGWNHAAAGSNILFLLGQCTLPLVERCSSNASIPVNFRGTLPDAAMHRWLFSAGISRCTLVHSRFGRNPSVFEGDIKSHRHSF